MDTVRISDRRNDIDLTFVHQFLSKEAHWQAGIGQETLKRALDNSLCISAFVGDRQVGFARIVTDYATFAWVDDVFIDNEFRGQGIAGTLLSAVTGHPGLSSVASWWLSSGAPPARALFQNMALPSRMRSDPEN